MSPRRTTVPKRNLDPLRGQRFFREFTLGELRRLSCLGSLCTYHDGELLATEGTRKQRRTLYVVLQGEVKYLKWVRGGRAKTMLSLKPGDVGGFLTFFNDEPSPVSVQSIGRTRVFEIGRGELHTLMADQPALGAKVLLALLQATAHRFERLLGRIAATSAWVLDLQHHLQGLPLTREE